MHAECTEASWQLLQLIFSRATLFCHLNRARPCVLCLQKMLRGRGQFDHWVNINKSLDSKDNIIILALAKLSCYTSIQMCVQVKNTEKNKSKQDLSNDRKAYLEQFYSLDIICKSILNIVLNQIKQNNIQTKVCIPLTPVIGCITLSLGSLYSV